MSSFDNIVDCKNRFSFCLWLDKNSLEEFFGGLQFFGSSFDNIVDYMNMFSLCSVIDRNSLDKFSLCRKSSK